MPGSGAAALTWPQFPFQLKFHFLALCNQLFYLWLFERIFDQAAGKKDTRLPMH